MKFWSKFTAFQLILVFLMGPSVEVLAQSYSGSGGTNSQKELMDAQRAKSTSFGSSEKDQEQGQLKQQIPSPLQSLQEQGIRGGLTYQVHVLGEVERPGTYRIPASTRLLEAVQLAGGVLERGSERRVELRRQGGGTRSVDLVSFKTFGNLDNNPYLLDNDVIFVPPLGKVVQVVGTVKRPGLYDLKAEKNIADLIKLAGGVTPGVDTAVPLKVVRFEGTQKRMIDVENTPSALRAFTLQTADVVVLPHILTESNKFDYNLAKLPGDNPLFYPSYDERVFVLGGINKPGPYPFSPYYDVRQYLTLAGGTTKLAKIKKIKVLTTDGKTVKATNNMQINPGDTIVVPEKYMAPETFATLVWGITSSLVAITVSVISLTR